ncbi:hypothetical protein PHYPSEUDO_001155 [Phytophthora pseudosyringae]|uniref:Uncharacterized protein n=1 Tax=Phytophthora pseudosyringae TaxID=221518 RepID=A0A8T1VWX0_9STRA|nr:hypothetical protein PHYPSEUDO_001155 [Phytophthora pseudosyringae]
MLEGGADATRGPECVDKVWDEQVDGAWAPGKAPVSLLTTFLKSVQERDSVEAERAAREILEAEPDNRLVRDLLEAMKQHDAMEAAEKAEEEEDDEDDDDEDADGDDGDGGEDDGGEDDGEGWSSSEEEEEEEDPDDDAKINDGE